VIASTFEYVAYIRTNPDKLWLLLTEPRFIAQYWFGMRCESQWTPGSSWELLSADGQVFDSGTIVEAEPLRWLSIRWQHQLKPELRAEGPSHCTMQLEPSGTAVKLTITHSIDRSPSKLIEAVSAGWPKVVSNLKSLLETGLVALMEPYPANPSRAGLPATH
jgi:uncharacterized protein YndB with AHSA1/START domain